MDYEQLKALVKEMRQAQRHYFALKQQGYPLKEVVQDALQRSKALEKRVDEEVADKPDNETTDHDCIRMANGQTLRQGNLFED